MLEVKELKKVYRRGTAAGGDMAAVNNVSFTLEDGQIYALAGESGSGKSTLSRLLMGLLAPTGGEILLDGKHIGSKKKRDQKLYRTMQLVLQDGKSALDPRFTVYDCIAEPIRNLLDADRKQEQEMVSGLLDRMELDRELLGRKPGELSGGQQKRVCIARAISVSPRYLIFDEALSGLDVIVRKHLLQLLKKLQQETKCTYLFITHDLDAALYIADHIFIMQNGRIVDQAGYDGSTAVFTHPYSKLLLSAVAP